MILKFTEISHSTQRRVEPQFFNQFSFVQHPDKTFIGKIDKGFDWMGFQITMQGIVSIAPRSMDKLIIKLAQLYEQNQPLLPIERALNYFQIKNRPLLIAFEALACLPAVGNQHDRPFRPLK
ncbi:hypothetical protein ACU5EH_02965 [Aliivibrio salmonicida]|uniref:hypothetical protein n=1 Tax=Aliivibrio salmonicida TaxID=40269 RepID=UPI00406CD4AA